MILINYSTESKGQKWAGSCATNIANNRPKPNKAGSHLVNVLLIRWFETKYDLMGMKFYWEIKLAEEPKT